MTSKNLTGETSGEHLGVNWEILPLFFSKQLVICVVED